MLDTEVVALRLQHPLNANGMPAPPDWERAHPIAFESDWQGKNADPQRRTEVRLLWTAAMLYLHFRCSYRSIHVFDNAEASGRRDHLWDRDVAEAFLQPDRLGSRYYKEFEVSPSGQWIDLEITPEGGKSLSRELCRVVTLDPVGQQWTAVVAIPMRTLTDDFDPESSWRVNFYRCEGVDPERAYLAWNPTHSPQPNFHVPESFGRLRFEF